MSNTRRDNGTYGLVISYVTMVNCHFEDVTLLLPWAMASIVIFNYWLVYVLLDFHTYLIHKQQKQQTDPTWIKTSCIIQVLNVHVWYSWREHSTGFHFLFHCHVRSGYDSFHCLLVSVLFSSLFGMINLWLMVLWHGNALNLIVKPLGMVGTVQYQPILVKL